ncbi:MAG: adenylate/guanylate cyclase domain-containing protein [Acetobacteraceae bacterium]|nr:adenylate/guanylate cyclase domain-containing protein [Acetobacteraceae bacterium]
MPSTSDGAAAAAPPHPARAALRRVAEGLLRLLGLGRDLAEPLPPRVQAMVREQQASAEILIGLAQVAAIATFGALYAIARHYNPPPTAIEPVPIALGLYAVFTGFRLWLALRRRLSAPLLVASVVIDMTVLMITIWSFHLQYMAPSAISLKAATLMYVFILIALRALRFDAFYVLLAGACAILGWASLVGYALLVDPMLGAITRSFLDYVTSPKVLLGAEFDKAVSIGMVTALLALVVLRGRRLLVDFAREGIAAAELSRFLVPEVAQRIRRSGGVMAGTAERRQAAILMADLRGFTRLARERPPCELLALLGEYQRLVVAAVHGRGGSIDKYLGDGVLASFGAVRPNGTYAADALRAVEDILAAIAARNAARPPGVPAFEVGVAVACGEVLFGTVGDADRLEYTVIGDPVNLAAKLEKHNKAEASQALADHATHELALAQDYAPRAAVEVRPARTVAGVPAPLDLVVLGRG